MISRTTEYALRAMVTLASDNGKAVLSPKIAETTGVPQAYLSKVLQTLVRAELVTSQRGQGGGFALAKPPSEITVLDVVDAVDSIQRIERCPLAIESHSESLCPLHQRLDEAIASIRASFGSTRLADLVSENRSALCPRGKAGK